MSASGPAVTSVLRIVADEDRCCGSGNCALTAPQLFDQREDDGVVVVLLDDLPAGEFEQAARTAVASCPTSALQLIGGSGA
ncbi:MAG: ferredoxin [Jatrophihabitans sp.]